MSDATVHFDGDRLVVPAYITDTLAERIQAIQNGLEQIQRCEWATGATDEPNVAGVVASVHKVLGQYLFPGVGGFGTAMGIQTDKVAVVRQIGENTEANTTEASSGWAGGRH